MEHQLLPQEEITLVELVSSNTQRNTLEVLILLTLKTVLVILSLLELVTSLLLEKERNQLLVSFQKEVSDYHSMKREKRESKENKENEMINLRVPNSSRDTAIFHNDLILSLKLFLRLIFIFILYTFIFIPKLLLRYSPLNNYYYIYYYN